MNNYLTKDYNLSDKNLIASLDEVPLWSAPFGLKLLQYIDYKTNIKALDIGSGTGFPLLEIAMRLGINSKVYGIDPWSEALDRIRFKAVQYGLENIELIDGKAENMPFDNNTFDLITSNNGINNVQDLNKVLDECYRVANMNAQLLFTVNLKRTMKEFYETLRSVLHRMGKEDEIRQINKHIYEKRKPLIELSEKIQDAGFIITQMMKDDFKYRFSNGILRSTNSSDY